MKNNKKHLLEDDNRYNPNGDKDGTKRLMEDDNRYHSHGEKECNDKSCSKESSNKEYSDGMKNKHEKQGTSTKQGSSVKQGNPAKHEQWELEAQTEGLDERSNKRDGQKTLRKEPKE